MMGDFVAKDHLACFVLSLVRDDLGLGEITGTYGGALENRNIDACVATGRARYAAEPCRDWL
jgi:hypothetical protein